MYLNGLLWNPTSDFRALTFLTAREVTAPEVPAMIADIIKE